ncbi:hypothetical protein J2X46_000542 [Nocardioides sp. BE266]|uniref:hypothetical protein n=1 Tax=Nocardioides sp. BE266 TaxID=2817725 RepID=UPI0028582567|nr:hypothetical protein [Nocardioides sp. BE266]MDR7251570.1 hypothetical protein [Nocardioides sp. BE266]
MRLQQPDRRSCGAASLVMARRLVDPHYAALVDDQATFAHEAATLHRRLTSLADAGGGWQVPWLRAIGTPPWAAARDLRLLTRVPYDVHPVRLGRQVWPHLATVAPDRPAVAYVGSRFLPRHVVLVTAVSDTAATTYEPSSGRLLTVARERWESEPLGLAGWALPWWVISPRSARRSPA